MTIHSACRTVICGAALLVATAMAAPDDAPTAVSSCLSQRVTAEKDTVAMTPPRFQMRSPCYLADVEKPEVDLDSADNSPPKDVQQRLDEIEMLSRLNFAPDDARQLPWAEHNRHGAGSDTHDARQDDLRSWLHNDNTMYQVPPQAHLAVGTVPAVPEPATTTMLLAGLAVLACVAPRRQRKA